MYAEESPWYETGRACCAGHVWYPDDDDEDGTARWYRLTGYPGGRIYRTPKDAPWAQGWKG